VPKNVVGRRQRRRALHDILSATQILFLVRLLRKKSGFLIPLSRKPTRQRHHVNAQGFQKKSTTLVCVGPLGTLEICLFKTRRLRDRQSYTVDLLQPIDRAEQMMGK